MTDDINRLDSPTSIPDSSDASLPSPVVPAPDGFDPFKDDPGVQSLTASPTSLSERLRLHFKESQTKGTIFGAAQHIGEAAVERAAIARGNPSDLENEVIDNSVKRRADLEAYDRMPDASSFLDYGAAIVGDLAGSLTSPESLIGEAVKIPYLLGKGAAGRVAAFGINQAGIQTAIDPVVQGLNIASGDGTRDNYSAYENFVEKPIGGLVGGVLLKGAHEVGSALFIKPQAEKDALTFFRTLRDHGDAADQKRWPDIADAVRGKTDAELADMAKQIGRDDKAAGENAAPKPAEPPPLPEEKAAQPPPLPEETPPAPEPHLPEPTPEPTPEPAPPIEPGVKLIGEPVPRMAPHRVTTADNRVVDVAPIVVEAADIKVSSDPGYDPALQPRDRDRAASQAQITNISTRLDPERLGASPEASHGAPIVGDDGMVESGNGRVMAIRDAYKTNGPAAQLYRDWLTKQGVDITKFKEPVLVRQRTTPMSPEERKAFTVAANQSSLLTMSAPERALADARNITVSDLAQIAVPNDIGAAGNAGFIRSFISKLPQGEQGALMDASGKVSQEGLIRVRNAIVARAYGDSHILIRIAESTNDDVKSMSNALVASAPAWAKLRSDVASGLVRADMDITPELIEAVSKTADLRNAGTKLDTFLSQIDAFTKLNETVEAFMRMFYKKSGRRAASAQDIAKNLRYYAEEAGKVTADAGLDLGMTPVKPRDILRTAAEKGFANERAKGETAGDLFGGGAGDGTDHAAGGAGSGRPGTDGVREGHGETGAGVDQGGQPDLGAEAGAGREAGVSDRGPVAEYNAAHAEADRLYPLSEQTDAKGNVTRYATSEHTAFTNGAAGYEWSAAMPIHVKEADVAGAYAAGVKWRSDWRTESAKAARDAVLASPEHAASRAMEDALTRIEDAVDSGDRSAVNTAGRAAKKLLADTPQDIKDADPDYWNQFGKLINKMMRKDYVVERGEGEALAIALDKRSAAEKKYFDNGPSKPIGTNDKGQTVYENKDGIRSVWDKDGLADREGHSTYGDTITPNQPRPARYKTTNETGDTLAAHGDGIGDALASSHDTGETLGVTMRTMQYSKPRAPENARATLTSNFVDAPNVRKMWLDFADELNATVRAGRMGSKNSLGEYYVRTGVIRMKQLDDPVVLAHEIGHHVEAEYGKPLQDIIFQRSGATFSLFGGRELDMMTNYSKSFKNPILMRKEGFAEFFRLLIENPAEANNRAPNFMQDFNRFLLNEPELKASIEKVQRLFDDYRTANAEDILRANIAPSVEPKGWDKLRQDVRNDGFWNTITERGSMIYTGVIDQHNPLAVAVQALLKTQKDNTGRVISLDAVDDSYKLIRLATNAHQAAMIDLMHGVTPYRSITPEGPSLYDAVALATGKPNILGGWDKVELKQFNSYLIARRGVFEWERRAAGLLDRDPMPFPKDMYEKEISVTESAKPHMKEAAEMLHEWNHNTLKKELDAGLITSEAYDAAMQVRDYVPLMRSMVDKSNPGGGDGSFDASNVGISKFKGSARPILPPLNSMMERAFRTAQLIAHNDAINALANLADKAGVGGGKLVERIPASELKARFVDPLEALRASFRDNGVSKVDADLAISTMLNDLRIDEKDIGPVAIFRSQQASARGENVIFHLVGGELKALRLVEGDFGKDLIMSLTGGLSPPLRDWNLQAMGLLSKTLRLGVTTSPDFFITNTLRDMMSNWILNRGTFPLVNSIKGIFREVTNSELSRNFAQMGGIAGGANVAGLDHARIEKDISALSTKGFTIGRLLSPEGFFKAIELSETGGRVGLFETQYKRALKQGLTPYEASIEAAFAANDTLDFGRHGSRIGGTIKLIPFLNAQLQGLDKAYRTLISPAFKEALTRQDVDAQKTMLSAYAKIAGLTGISMALRGLYIDDPEYSELSPYMRNTHWMVRVPGAKDGKIVNMAGQTVDVPAGGLRSLWLAIPKPFELAIIPNLGERAVEMLYNKDPAALSRWMWGALDLVSAKTMMSSIAIKTSAEMVTGKNLFTGRDIVPDHLKGLEPWAQSTAGTSSLSKYIGSAADRVQRSLGMEGGGLSPMYIDQLITGVAGSQARNVLSLVDAAIGTKGDQSLADTAIAQRVFKESYRGSTSNTEFWSQVADKTGRLAQAASTYQHFLDTGNPSDAANYVARLPEDKRVYTILQKSDFKADEKQLHPLVNAHKAVTAITNMTREIAEHNLTEAATLDSIKLTPSEQRVALDALGRIQMWTARNALITSGTVNLKGQNPAAIDADLEALHKTVPAVYDELAQRFANAKVYKASSIAEHWDEVRQAVVADGSEAQLRGVAHEVARDGFELDERKAKEKKVKPHISGTDTVQ